MTLLEANAAKGQEELSRAFAAWLGRTLRAAAYGLARRLANHPAGVLPQ